MGGISFSGIALILPAAHKCAVLSLPAIELLLAPVNGFALNFITPRRDRRPRLSANRIDKIRTNR